jgi:hypothetical protein
MIIELKDTRGRLIGRIDERHQAPAALCPQMPRPALAEVREDAFARAVFAEAANVLAERAERGEVGREEVRA